MIHAFDSCGDQLQLLSIAVPGTAGAKSAKAGRICAKRLATTLGSTYFLHVVSDPELSL